MLGTLVLLIPAILAIPYLLKDIAAVVLIRSRVRNNENTAAEVWDWGEFYRSFRRGKSVENFADGSRASTIEWSVRLSNDYLFAIVLAYL